MAGLRAQHVLAVPAAENTLRLLPPLIISEDEIDIVLGTLGHILETNKT
jgi:acetylornithine/succinyldiaminopimelate/putrescine aminotransferase